MKKITLLLSFLLVSAVMYAQLTLSGEYRPRYEYKHGVKTLYLDNSQIVSNVTQRARLNLDYKNNKIKFGLQLQDVRTWGDVRTLNTTDDKFSIHQAWGEIIFSDNVSLKLGRQELSYDDQRIFGAVNWTQQARSHDLALLKVGISDDTKINVGLALNQADAFAAPYENMQYAWIHHGDKKFGVSLLAMNLGIDKTEDGLTYYNQTLGTHLFFKALDQLKMLGSFYYQMGKKSESVDYAAMQFMLGANFAINDNIGVNAAFEHLSGDDFGTADKQESFTPWFGTNHKFNGWMDYFYVGSPHNNVGLNDISLGVTHKKGKISTGITGHYFMSAVDNEWVAIYPITGETTSGTENALGTEFDAFFGYKINKDVLLKVGASYLIPSEGMTLVKPVNIGTGASAYEESNFDFWVMFILKPTFLISK